MVWRLLWGGVLLGLALAMLAGLAGAWLFWRAMPSYSGRETLPGLSAEVHVWRDAYGAPHIFAASMDDAMRGLGYLHASERLFQMELQRRVGQGRLAEVFGADRLDVDKFTGRSASTPRPKAASRRFRRGRKSGCRRTLTASTPSSAVTQPLSPRSFCSWETGPSRGSRPTRSSWES
jgi:Penicillin amidase